MPQQQPQLEPQPQCNAAGIEERKPSANGNPSSQAQLSAPGQGCADYAPSNQDPGENANGETANSASSQSKTADVKELQDSQTPMVEAAAALMDHSSVKVPRELGSADPSNEGFIRSEIGNEMCHFRFEK